CRSPRSARCSSQNGVPFRAPRLRIIVNYATDRRQPGHGAVWVAAPWNVIVTVAPWPRTLVRSIVPPQLSTRRRAIASPNADPLDVVENAGSNARGSAAGA